VREVLRLKTAGVSGNEIARRLGVAPSTVRMTLQRLAAAGLSWPPPAEMARQAIPRRRALNGRGGLRCVYTPNDRLLNTNKSVNSTVAPWVL
jgi:DNA-binding MarR family transcriptional regulator